MIPIRLDRDHGLASLFEHDLIPTTGSHLSGSCSRSLACRSLACRSLAVRPRPVASSHPNATARASSSVEGRRGPRETSQLAGTATGGARQELFLSGFPTELQIPGALEHDDDAGLVKRGGAQLEQSLGNLLAIAPRDLQTAGADILHQHRERDAQGRLPESVHLVDRGALADQEFDDVSQALIGRLVQRRPAILTDGIDINPTLNQKLDRLDGLGALLGRSRPLDVRAAA